jgi:hypothetical protein
MWEDNRRIEVQVRPGQPYLKIKTKSAGDMAQVVECLPSKCKALNSNTSTAKKKIKK